MDKLKVFLCAAVLISLPLEAAAAATYTDVPEMRADYIAIEALTDAGIFQGYDDGTFKPDNGVNRAEALKIIFKSAGINPSGGLYATGFSDVPIDAWYAGYVMEGVLKGIISGNPDGTFAGERGVNTAEFLKMTLLSFQTDLSRHQNPADNIAADVPAGAWYMPYLSYAKAVGLVYPDVSYNMYPSKNLTRGECAQIIYKMLVIHQGGETQKMLSITEARLVEAMIMQGLGDTDAAANYAKTAVYYGGLAMELTPESTAVQAVAKITTAFSRLFDAYLLAEQSGTENVAAEEILKLLSEAEALADEATAINATSSWLTQKIHSYADELRGQF